MYHQKYTSKFIILVLEYELYLFCPLKEITTNISFAPIGLLNMFNTGGDVEYFQVIWPRTRNRNTLMARFIPNCPLLSVETDLQLQQSQSK
ncbi:hypothetical protein Vadar_030964 [Vaccinium darrowii]|uniref:Uncharacterized protein n=1 Tax=Vaccinium darrowii TaxID=229202 RepID=A0ACB7XUN7_9ERIC|nr:hypothetical protein Vadar_030964 [Vaccinium darrowii]